MSTFTLAISCLSTSNLPWFMALTFQVPMQYCSLQHQTLLLSPVTPTTGYYFCFGSFPSFFLELFLHWSPVTYWAPTDLGSSHLSILSFCLFILFMVFLKQQYWSDLPFPKSSRGSANLSLGPCGSKARLTEGVPGGVLRCNRARAVSLPPGPTTGLFVPCSLPIIKAGMCGLLVGLWPELNRATSLWVRQGCGPSVIRLTSFLWVWFQCVCPLMPSCNTYRLTWVSLTWINHIPIKLKRKQKPNKKKDNLQVSRN